MVLEGGGGALVGVGGLVAVYGLSSWDTTSGTFCAVSDHGGLGFHWSMKSIGSLPALADSMELALVW